MKNSLLLEIMRTQKLTKLYGKLGESVGTLIVPTRGTITLEIQGQILYSQQKTAFGLETRKSYVLLNKIDSVEIVAGRIWWLFWVGLATILIWLIGVLFLLAFFLIQQQWLLIQSGRTSYILFFPTQDRAKIEQFAQTLLTQIRAVSLPRTQPNPQNPSPKTVKSLPS